MPHLASPADGRARALARTFIAKYRRARRLVPENASTRGNPSPGDVIRLARARRRAPPRPRAGRRARGTRTGTTMEWPAMRPMRPGTRRWSWRSRAARAEEALRAPPNHAELRLCLVAVRAAGRVDGGERRAAPLDVKNIQMDTMAHHVLSCAESGCASSVLLEYCGLAERLNADARRDIAEAGVKAARTARTPRRWSLSTSRARRRGGTRRANSPPRARASPLRGDARARGRSGAPRGRDGGFPSPY